MHWKNHHWMALLFVLLTGLGLVSCSSLEVEPSGPQVRVTQAYVIPKPKGYRFENRPHERTKPIVVGDIIFYATLSGHVKAIHRVYGYELWSKKMPGRVEGALAYARAHVYVGDDLGNFYALRASNGQPKWNIKFSSQLLSAPVIFRDRIFVHTSDSGLYALNDSGEQVWYHPQKGDEKKTIRGVSTPAVYPSGGGEVYVGFDDGSIMGFSADNGRVLWRQQLRKRKRFYDPNSPYVDKDHVLVATYDGSLFNLKRINGEYNWVFRVGAYGGFLVEKEDSQEDRIYFAGLNGYFYALGMDSGNVIWKTKFDGGVGLAPSRVGDYLVFTTSKDPIYLVDPEDGKIVWKGRLGAGTMTPAAVDPDGWFFCLSNYGNLFAYFIDGVRDQPKVSENFISPSAIFRNTL